jgi:hypothetical protein
MRVSYENKTLLETITFIVPGLGTTTVVLEEGTESLTFLLQFESVAEKKSEELLLESVDKTTGKLVFTNWDNVLGTGLVQPLEMGVFQKRKLYLLPFIRKIGSKSDQKMVTLSFYSGEEVPDGQN